MNRALHFRSGFPLGLPAGSRTARRFPLLSIPLEDTSDRPANVGVEPPCGVPTKGESKKEQRRKLNEIGVRYRFLLRACNLWSLFLLSHLGMVAANYDRH